MSDHKYAFMVESIIFHSIRDQVEQRSETALAEILSPDDDWDGPADGFGFFHLYRAMNDGIVYCGCAPDIYDGIQRPEFADAVMTRDSLVLVSHGWAAPGEWDGSPAECPDRRRVRLTVVVGRPGDFVSVLRFPDHPDEKPIAESDSGGPLREAIEKRMSEVLASMN
jgi:hypothetical protein